MWMRGYGTKLVWNSVRSTFNWPSKRREAVILLKHGVAAQHTVVRLHDDSADLRGRVDGEFCLRLLAVVDAQPVQQQRREARASAATEGVEYHETLQACAVVRQLPCAVEHQVHDLLADCVVAASIVVGGVLLARDELLWVVQATVGARADLVHHSGLQINHQ